MLENDKYYCDRCDEEFKDDEESFEVNYGFICRNCSERF